jgi:uncharacterized protein YdeI (YjbR/CyaY-like superfamily)
MAHPISPTWFDSYQDLFDWFEVQGTQAEEIWIGFYKKGTGLHTLAVDEAQALALCFGWVETRTRSMDDHSYAIRYKPRKKNGVWSQNNIEKMETLIAEGMAMPAGILDFQNRKKENTQRYSYENQPLDFSDDRLASFQLNSIAWRFWESTSPSYRRKVTFWVERAQLPATRDRRFTQLVEACERGQKLGPA